MGATYWIKLYDEILDDPKMARLPDRLWRRVTECFLFAGREREGGYLPPLEDMAWTLRCSEEELESDLQAIADRCGILELRDGRWFVVQFESRQARVSDAERQSRRRDRVRSDQYRGGDSGRDTECHESVTSRDSARHEVVTNRAAEADTDTEAEGEAETEAEADAAPPTGRRTATEIYAQITSIEPSREVSAQIERHVGHDPPALDLWEQVVREWILRSWKPTNVAGMLDYFERDEVPGQRQRSAATRTNGNGNGSREGSSYLTGAYADIIKH